MQQLARLMMVRRLISLIWLEEMYTEDDDDDDDDAHTDMLEPQGFDKKPAKSSGPYFSQTSRPLLRLAFWG